MITPQILDEIERLYTPADRQKCVVCGAPLRCSATDDGVSRYHCSNPAAATGMGYGHRRDSEWRDYGQTSETVVLLVRAYRELIADGVTATVLRNLRDEIYRNPMDLISTGGSVVMERVLKAIDDRIQ